VLRQQQSERAVRFQEAAWSSDDNGPAVGVEDTALLRETVELVTSDQQDLTPTCVYDLDYFGCQSQVGGCFRQD
jgi:hypothetical protein